MSGSGCVGGMSRQKFIIYDVDESRLRKTGVLSIEWNFDLTSYKYRSAAPWNDLTVQPS